MNILSADNISKKTADIFLFRNASFGLNEGEKIGLIGTNGSGKSTLMQLLAGQREPDSGSIVRRRNLNISYLHQSPKFNGDSTIHEILHSGTGRRITLLREYHSLCESLSTQSEADQNRLDDMRHEMEIQGVWRLESDLRSILHRLNLPDSGALIKTLSGGMLRRVALAQVLVEDADLLLLDEPTNHLDIEGAVWLEQRLKKTKQAIVLITHDRYFLERITNRIVEIDSEKLQFFEGPYDFYLERKAERAESSQRADEKTRNFLRRELEWLRRQPKARGTKQKSRVDRINKKQQAKTYAPAKAFEFSVAGSRLGKRILEAKNLSKSYDGRLLFQNFDYAFKNGERIGILGANGSGKSTLLEILLNRIEPDTGSVIPGINTRFGYYEQNALVMDPDRRTLEFIRHEAGEYIETADGGKMRAQDMLDYFHFDGRLQASNIGRLSGGELRRLYLVYVLMGAPNFLILDEPTNDFDSETISRLEELLLNFKGCILIVSHDRYLLDRIADQLLIFNANGEIEKFAGSCSKYLESKMSSVNRLSENSRRNHSKTPENQNDLISSTQSEKANTTNSIQKTKFSFAEKREFDSLEKEIPAIEEKIKISENALNRTDANYEEMKQIGEDHVQLTNQLALKTERWMELAESVESTD